MTGNGEAGLEQLRPEKRQGCQLSPNPSSIILEDLATAIRKQKQQKNREVGREGRREGEREENRTSKMWRFGRKEIMLSLFADDWLLCEKIQKTLQINC